MTKLKPTDTGTGSKANNFQVGQKVLDRKTGKIFTFEYAHYDHRAQYDCARYSSQETAPIVGTEYSIAEVEKIKAELAIAENKLAKAEKDAEAEKKADAEDEAEEKANKGAK